MACSLPAQTPASQPAQQAVGERADTERRFHALNDTRLTGDCGGARNWLANKGIEFGLSMTATYRHNTYGGLDTHNGHDIIGSLDTQLMLDFEKMGLWKGGILYLLAESSWNTDIGLDKVGTLHAVDGDAYGGDEPIQVSELWYQQTFLDEKIRVKVDKRDLMIHFDLNGYANDETSQFLNIALRPWLNVTPDFQWIHQPHGTQAIHDSFAVGVRMQMAF